MAADHEAEDAGATSAWDDLDSDSEKTRRRVARQLVRAHHEEQLRQLLEHVRGGFAELDAGRIDVFDLDDLIHRYHRAAAKLWGFCGSSGGQWLRAAQELAYERDNGEAIDWWALGADPRRDDVTSAGADELNGNPSPTTGLHAGADSRPWAFIHGVGARFPGLG